MTITFERFVKAYCPENTHPMPLAEVWDGVKWTVDIQLRTSEIDIDGTGVDIDLDTARIKALRRLKKTRTMYERHGYLPTESRLR